MESAEEMMKRKRGERKDEYREEEDIFRKSRKTGRSPEKGERRGE